MKTENLTPGEALDVMREGHTVVDNEGFEWFINRKMEVCYSSTAGTSVDGDYSILTAWPFKVRPKEKTWKPALDYSIKELYEMMGYGSRLRDKEGNPWKRHNDVIVREGMDVLDKQTYYDCRFFVAGLASGDFEVEVEE